MARHVCPWWLTYTFDNPLRRIFQSPAAILDGLVKRGGRVLDVGCGMGYFTVPLARMVGDQGVVYAVDVQKEMLAAVRRRAAKAGVLSRIRMIQCTESALGVTEVFDFALAFWMVHEAPDQSRLLQEIFSALKPTGKLLIVEPKGHVTAEEFLGTMRIAQSLGFTPIASLSIAMSRGALLSKNNNIVTRQ